MIEEGWCVTKKRAAKTLFSPILLKEGNEKRLNFLDEEPQLTQPHLIDE